LRHAGDHRAGRIDHPRIPALLEPERDHVVLSIGRTQHDGAEDFLFGEAGVPQEVIREQFEAVAVVAIVGERLLERRPVIVGPVGHVVTLRLVLHPSGDRFRRLALLFGAEREVGNAEVVTVASACRRFRTARDGRETGCELVGIAERAFAHLPTRDLPRPRIVGRGDLEELVRRPRRSQRGDTTERRARADQAQQQQSACVGQPPRHALADRRKGRGR
jgi:hypothetical protein